MVDLNALESWLQHKKKGQHHRQILTLQLAPDDTIDILRLLFDAYPKHLFISENARFLANNDNSTRVLQRPSGYKRLLGNEFDLVVFDICNGVDLNSLYAVSGMLVKSGILAIIDSHRAAHRCGIKLSYGSSTSNSVFYDYFSHLLKQDNVAYINMQTTYLPSSRIVSDSGSDSHEQIQPTPCSSTLNQQQSEVLEHIKLQLQKPSKTSKIFTILGERGRGKSTLLAHIAWQYFIWYENELSDTNKHDAKEFGIEVCSAFRDQSAQVLTTFNRLCENNDNDSKFTICYRAADDIIAKPQANKLLIIDEVASLSPQLIKQLVSIYKTVILCGTTAGYEGSAKGFAQRVLPFLYKTKNINTYTVSSPIRWHKDDPIEQFFNTLMGQAESEVLTEYDTQRYVDKRTILEQASASSKTSKDKLRLRDISKLELIKTPSLFQSLIKLLADAHYQTTPNDIVRILDEEHCRIMVIEDMQESQNSTRQSRIIGALSLFEEGGDSLQTLSWDIANQHRRVQGHLSAQALASYILKPSLCALKYWRIHRIAISPHIQGKGLGSKLLKYCEAQAQENSVDVISTSFGFTSQLFNFWQSNNFTLVKLGQRIDTSSASASVILVKPLSSALNPSIAQLQAKLRADYVYFSEYDLVLDKIYAPLANLISAIIVPKHAFDSLLEKIYLAFIDNKLAFSKIASVLHDLNANIDKPEIQNRITSLLKTLYKGHLHKYQRETIESEILTLLRPYLAHIQKPE